MYQSHIWYRFKYSRWMLTKIMVWKNCSKKGLFLQREGSSLTYILFSFILSVRQEGEGRREERRKERERESGGRSEELKVSFLKCWHFWRFCWSVGCSSARFSQAGGQPSFHLCKTDLVPESTYRWLHNLHMWLSKLYYISSKTYNKFKIGWLLPYY